MGIRSRLVIGVVVATMAVLGTALPASAQQPTPTTNPLVKALENLFRPPPRRPGPTVPPPAPPAPPSAPSAPANSGSGKRIVYCVGCQRVWLVESDERVSRTHLVSGRANIPRKGTYSVFSKSMKAVAGSRKATMTHMVRFARGRSLAIGFHAIPRDLRGRPIQTEAQLGTYRSLGCVRQADADAVALWNFAPLGTKVVVT